MKERALRASLEGLSQYLISSPGNIDESIVVGGRETTCAFAFAFAFVLEALDVLERGSGSGSEGGKGPSGLEL